MTNDDYDDDDDDDNGNGGDFVDVGVVSLRRK